MNQHNEIFISFIKNLFELLKWRRKKKLVNYESNILELCLKNE